MAQTTQPLERVTELVEALQARFPNADVRFIDTVCQPTKDRQRALRELAAETDVVIVVGGPDSNNSRKLAELARGLGRPAHLVANAAELRPEWFDDCEVVGVTAGTSTPEAVVEGVRMWLERLRATTRSGDVTAAPVGPKRAAVVCFHLGLRSLCHFLDDSVIFAYFASSSGFHSSPSRKQRTAAAVKSCAASTNSTATCRPFSAVSSL